MGKSERTIFSDSELQEIHKALHDKRRKFITIRGEKQSIFERINLRQMKYLSTVFTQFTDDSGKFANAKATIAMHLNNVHIKYWNVVDDNGIYKNKRDFYAKVQK